MTMNDLAVILHEDSKQRGPVAVVEKKVTSHKDLEKCRRIEREDVPAGSAHGKNEARIENL